jgi:hypothetical protein
MTVACSQEPGGKKPAALDLTWLLAAKKSLERIAIILLQISLAEQSPVGA